MSTIDPESLSDESLAVDGNSDQSMLKGSCFYTGEEDNPWWRVDLFDIYEIFMVRLYNRIDCCSDLAHDVQLRVGPSLDTIVDAVFVEGQINDIHNIVLPINTEVRFIELVRNGWGAFHLCEVEVFGKKATCKYDPFQNGGNCSVVHCEYSDNCRNYTCTCPDGLGGVDCDVCTFNVAVGKEIEASSIYHKKWLPSNVIDGDTGQNVRFGATCVSTQTETEPYLMLDLGEEYNITGINVYRRLDCCAGDIDDIELFLMLTSWTRYGYNDERIESISKFGIYPYVSTRYVKIVGKTEMPSRLQICEIKVFSFCQETELTDTTSSKTMIEEPMPYIQMRFSLSDKYSDVVKSEKSFKQLISKGLSSQTGFLEECFRNLEIEKEPFRVAFELHAIEGDRTTLNNMLKKIERMNRFGILEIETPDGQLLAIIAGSLQYHMLYEGNAGTRLVSPVFLMISSVIPLTIRYM